MKSYVGKKFALKFVFGYLCSPS